MRKSFPKTECLASQNLEHWATKWYVVSSTSPRQFSQYGLSKCAIFILTKCFISVLCPVISPVQIYCLESFIRVLQILALGSYMNIFVWLYSWVSRMWVVLDCHLFLCLFSAWLSINFLITWGDTGKIDSPTSSISKLVPRLTYLSAVSLPSKPICDFIQFSVILLLVPSLLSFSLHSTTSLRH